eukprot:Sdes_comp20127_c0_seq2m13185
MSTSLISEQYLKKAEEFSEEVYRRGRKVLPTIARIFLVATFLDDGFRLFIQWNEQSNYIGNSLGWGFIFAYPFLLVNILLQIGGSFCVVARKEVKYGVGALFSVVFTQTCVYSTLWDLNFFLRNLALCGGLILLLTEVRKDGNRFIAGLPDISDRGDTNRSYMQLAGRLLLVLMFISLIHLSNVSVFKALFYVVGSGNIVYCLFLHLVLFSTPFLLPLPTLPYYIPCLCNFTSPHSSFLCTKPPYKHVLLYTPHM